MDMNIYIFQSDPLMPKRIFYKALIKFIIDRIYIVSHKLGMFVYDIYINIFSCRYMGTITGISDLDSVRWPNSHWRSVKVCIETFIIFHWCYYIIKLNAICISKWNINNILLWKKNYVILRIIFNCGFDLCCRLAGTNPLQVRGNLECLYGKLSH
jgi:hypothetical protein